MGRDPGTQSTELHSRYPHTYHSPCVCKQVDFGKQSKIILL